MAKQLFLDPEYGVTERNGVPVVSSRYVASVFQKEHRHVVEAIRVTVGNINNFNRSFSEMNFKASSYKVRGRLFPEFLMTQDGFALIVMGFTGDEAARFKVAYITHFNDMATYIRNIQELKAEYPDFTHAIMGSHTEPKHYHFSTEVDMINRIALGVSARQFKEQHGLEKVNSIRPYLSPNQLIRVKTLQRADIGLILAVPEFERRKQMLTTHHASMFGLAAHREELAVE